MQVKSHSEVEDEVLQGFKKKQSKKNTREREFVMKAALNRTSVPFSFMALQTSCFHQVQAIEMSKKKKIVPKQGNYW